MVDHVHMLLSIPPKYAVSQVMGYIKGKSAIHIARTLRRERPDFVGQHFWVGAIGYRGSDTTRPPCGCIALSQKKVTDDSEPSWHALRTAFYAVKSKTAQCQRSLKRDHFRSKMVPFD